MKRILLVGGGHSHLEVILNLPPRLTAENNFILVSENQNSLYTGLLPRLIAGQITVESATIPIKELCESLGVQFIQDKLESFDENQKRATFLSGKTIDYDYLSLNLGGQMIPLDLPENITSICVRPFSQFLNLWISQQKRIATKDRIVISGSGAAAFEIAIALQIKKKTENWNSQIQIVHSKKRLCPYFPKGLSDFLERTLIKQGIQIFKSESLQKWITESSQPTKDIFVINANSLKSYPLIKANVDEYLRLDSTTFASGDCVNHSQQIKIPKSGVLAVHQGRHLVHTIKNILRGSTPLSFKPRKFYLSILITGERTAVAVWGPFWIEGRIPWILKNWIDMRYISSFKKLIAKSNRN